jgi:hypothetical protein
MGGSGFPRRVLLRGGAVAAAGCLFGPAVSAEAAVKAAPGTGGESGGGSGDVITYVSMPDLQPPRIAITQPGSPAARDAASADGSFFLLTTEGPAGQHGLLMLDRQGEVVWFRPAPPAGLTKNLNVQTYQGKPVLTWWESPGKLSDKGIGAGTGYLADSSYKVIATVHAANGLYTDFHELNLTDQGTALITTYRTRPADLSGLGGVPDGTVLSGVAQEIDIATGALVFEWDSLDHVPVTETMHRFDRNDKQNFDYFHINSIAVADDGNLLISARNTCTVYKVDRRSGEIKWRLGGKQSDFAMGEGAAFWWQHHARAHQPGVLSIFDDGASPAHEQQSRGILLQLDTHGKGATLLRAYTSPQHPLAVNQGSMQVLPDGGVFIGWGSQPCFSQFTAAGEQVLYGQFPRGDWSYRAFTQNWTGVPAQAPVVVIRRDPSGASVAYVSWNGATGVAAWTLSAGATATTLNSVRTQRKTTFETAIWVPDGGPYFQATALDGSNRELGRSAVVRQ